MQIIDFFEVADELKYKLESLLFLHIKDLSWNTCGS